MGAPSGDELVKYITERFVGYIETPKEERSRSKDKTPWSVTWFGMLPVGLSLWRSGRKEARNAGERRGSGE